jgi:hypothetical protein
MKIYVTHSTSFDYQNELYKPLRNSELNLNNEITLPHEKSSALFDSKNYMQNCDLVIAEVSYPSIGQGIELGWANMYDKRIICIYKSGSKTSSSINAVSKEIYAYSTADDLISVLTKLIKA